MTTNEIFAEALATTNNSAINDCVNGIVDNNVLSFGGMSTADIGSTWATTVWNGSSWILSETLYNDLIVNSVKPFL